MIVPGMRWERSPDGLTVTRHGNVLRVYLDRPWFTTGEDEYLGVLFGKSANEVRTEWGADPVRRRDAPGATTMTPAHLTNPTASLTMEDHEGIDVDVIMFEVQYDPDQGLHYADIEVASEGAYTPFVRLVVARVQPFSVIEGGLDLRVSENLRTEWIQPAPTRQITVSRTGPDNVHVTVRGVASGDGLIGPDQPDAEGFAPDSVRAGRHSVCVRVETNERGTSDVAWEPSKLVPSLLHSCRRQDDPGITYWRGFARVDGTTPGGPDLRADGGTGWRLSVYEIELYPSDADTAGPVSGFNV